MTHLPRNPEAQKNNELTFALPWLLVSSVVTDDVGRTVPWEKKKLANL